MARNRAQTWRPEAVLLALLGLGCGGSATPPNVLLIVADTLRADRLGSYASERSLTPFLDDLASRGTVFANAYAPSSWTCPSIASAFTSRHPLQHRVADFDAPLASSEITLAERLRAAGYASGGFSANHRITRELGYAQGFDTWWAPSVGFPKLRGEALNERALSWIDEAWRPQPRRPVFLYLQYFDPHPPYDPPDQHRDAIVGSEVDLEAATAINTAMMELRFQDLSPREVELLERLYDAEVAYLDATLRALFAELDRRGFLDGAIVVFTADHGEEFREHGFMLHGLTLYDASVRVPMILVGPGIEGGSVVTENVSLLQLAPTLLELVGSPPAGSFEGRSLVPALEAASGARALEASGPHDVLLELAPKPVAFDLRAHATGIIRGTKKLVVDPAGRATLYDLAADPFERSPRSEEGSGHADALVRDLASARAELATRASPMSRRVPLEPDEERELRALGYLREGKEPASREAR